MRHPRRVFKPLQEHFVWQTKEAGHLTSLWEGLLEPVDRSCILRST